MEEILDKFWVFRLTWSRKRVYFLFFIFFLHTYDFISAHKSKKTNGKKMKEYEKILGNHGGSTKEPLGNHCIESGQVKEEILDKCWGLSLI